MRQLSFSSRLAPPPPSSHVWFFGLVVPCVGFFGLVYFWYPLGERVMPAGVSHRGSLVCPSCCTVFLRGVGVGGGGRGLRVSPINKASPGGLPWTGQVKAVPPRGSWRQNLLLSLLCWTVSAEALEPEPASARRMLWFPFEL